MSDYYVYIGLPGRFIKAFDTKDDATKWVLKEVNNWRLSGGKSPEYRVSYNPSGLEVFRWSPDQTEPTGVRR